MATSQASARLARGMPEVVAVGTREAGAGGKAARQPDRENIEVGFLEQMPRPLQAQPQVPGPRRGRQLLLEQALQLAGDVLVSTHNFRFSDIQIARHYDDNLPSLAC